MKFLYANRRRRVLRRHIWGYAVCLCPTERTPGLNELSESTFILGVSGVVLISMIYTRNRANYIYEYTNMMYRVSVELTCIIRDYRIFVYAKTKAQISFWPYFSFSYIRTIKLL